MVIKKADGIISDLLPFSKMNNNSITNENFFNENKNLSYPIMCVAVNELLINYSIIVYSSKWEKGVNVTPDVIA